MWKRRVEEEGRGKEENEGVDKGFGEIDPPRTTGVELRPTWEGRKPLEFVRFNQTGSNEEKTLEGGFVRGGSATFHDLFPRR